MTTFCPLCSEVEGSMFCCQAKPYTDTRLARIELTLWAARFAALNLTGAALPARRAVEEITDDMWNLLHGGASYETLASRFDGWLRWLWMLPPAQADAAELRLAGMNGVFHPQDAEVSDLARRIREDMINNGIMEVR